VLHRVPAGITPLHEWLRPIIDDVVLITASEVAENYRGRVPSVLAFPDYEHNPQVLDTLCRLCADGVTRVVHVTEGDVLRAATVRTAYGLPGIQHEAALAFRDKVVMKRAVRRAGLPVPRFHTDTAPRWTRRFLREVGGRVVIKPRDGVGSRGVQVVTDESTLATELAQRGGNVLLEEFVPGRMLHADGFMSGGRALVTTVSAYIGSCLGYREQQPLASVQLDRDGARFVHAAAFTDAVIAALPPTDFSPFHLEIFVEERTGRLVFCEIACRLGGGYIMQTLGLALGVNPAKLAIQHQAGLIDGNELTFDIDARCHGFLLIPPRAGLLRRIDTPPASPFLTGFQVHTDYPREFSGANSSGDFICSYIVSAADERTARRHLADCHVLANSAIHWE
jgi:hypothetical protein